MTWFESRKAQKINLILSAFMYEFEEGDGSKKNSSRLEFLPRKKFDPMYSKKFDPAWNKFHPARKKFEVARIFF